MQGDLRALDQGSKEFADQTVRQKVMSDVDERFNALASQLAANQPKSDVYADVVRILEKIQTEVKALNEWKHSIKSQTGSLFMSTLIVIRWSPLNRRRLMIKSIERIFFLLL